MKSSGLVLSMFVLVAALTGAWKVPHAATTNNDKAEISALLDRWAKAFEAHDIDGIMANYAPGDAVVAYDIGPPLQYKGKESYRKDYQEFLSQYDGPIHVEYRDMRIVSSGDVGFVHALERFSGRLKGGQQSDMWLRYTGGLQQTKREVANRSRSRLCAYRLRKWKSYAGPQALKGEETSQSHELHR